METADLDGGSGRRAPAGSAVISALHGDIYYAQSVRADDAVPASRHD